MKKIKLTRICDFPTKIGDIIRASGYNWIAVYEDDDSWILTTDVCVSECASYNVRQAAKDFENTLDPAFSDRLVPGMYGMDMGFTKVFIPASANVDYDLSANWGSIPHTELNGFEWSYFNSNERRKCKACPDSPGDFGWHLRDVLYYPNTIWYITEDGKFSYGFNNSIVRGFRPFVALKK